MKPLAGQRVMITRPRDAAAELAAGLEALGAEVLVCPTIAILPPEDWAPLDEALEHLCRYAWVLFTSRHAVTAFCDRLKERELPTTLQLGAVGAQTAKALVEFGLQVQLVAEPATAQALAEQLLARESLRGAHVLFPRGNRARDVLPSLLREAGAIVDDPIVYRTVSASNDPLQLAGVDWIVLTSPSTWHELHALGGAPLSGVRLAAIGPTTAEAIRLSGYEPACIADPPGLSGLLAAICEVGARKE